MFFIIHYATLSTSEIKSKTKLHWLVSNVKFNTQKRIEPGKNGDKDRKASCKLMNNDTRFVSNRKDYLKWTSKLSYVSQKVFDNNLVGIRKSKVTLTLNKPAYVGICILDLTETLMYEFHYDYIKNKYDNNSGLLLTDTDSLMHEIKTKTVYEDFSKGKEMFDFIQLSQNIIMIQTN